MNSINIDTVQLAAEIEKIKNVKNNFEQIFEEIKKDTESLKEYWNTTTSESVFTSFESFYTALQNVTNTFQKDIEFLEKTVSSNYVAEEQGLNKIINEKMTS